MKYYKKNFLSVNKIKILIIVRLASKRLKNKAKKKVGNYSITEILILRLLKFFDSTSIIICTTRNQNNTFLKKISLKYNTSFFAGAEKNIFKRIIDCVKKFKFNNFVRVTGDNPLTDSQSIIQMTKSHIKNKNDFTYTESLPLGMRPEIISMKALIKASSSTVEPLEVFITIACFGNNSIAELSKIFLVSDVAGVCIDTKSQSGIIELTDS